MSLVESAVRELYPDKEFNYNASIKYSGKFKPYNANVRLRGRNLIFNLSRNWRTVSKEIRIGLIQELLVKVVRDKSFKRTSSMDLYTIFIKKAEIAAPKTKIDPFLAVSFERVNEKYFNGMIEKPNLVWHDSSRRLGTYEYGSDTISMTKALRDADQDVLDYVMYHEILHKKYKFVNKNGRNYHHTTQFKNKEKEFKNQAEIERKIKCLRIPRKKRAPRKSFLSRLFFP
jgi:hypothetical protein